MVADQANCLFCNNKSVCFRELTESELKRVTENKVEISYKKDETIIKQHSFASNIYFIKKGLVKIYLENIDRNLIIEIGGEGKMLGLTSLNHTKHYKFSATAIEDVVLCEINVEVINEIMKTNQFFNSQVIASLNTTIEKILNKLYCISHKNLNGRLAEALLCFSNDIYKSNKFTLGVSRKDLADITNMATENVVRLLKEFNEKKYIKLSGKNVEILNYSALKQLSR